MTDDEFFRWVFVGVIVIFFPFLMYYRIRSATAEKLDRWQEGVAILFGLRLGALPLLIAGIFWMFNPASVAWASLPLPLPARWLGAALLLGWGFLSVWAFSNLGANLTDTVVTRKNHTLVCDGPYRYVRHPFYTSFMLAVAGIFLLSTNGFLLVLGSIPLAFLVIRTPIEEAKLVACFGDEYRQYMARTGRFWPYWRRPTS